LKVDRITVRDLQTKMDFLDLQTITCEHQALNIYGEINYWIGRFDEAKEEPETMNMLKNRLDYQRDKIIERCWKKK